MEWYIWVITLVLALVVLALFTIFAILAILVRGIGRAAGQAVGTWANGNFGPRHK